jgi:2-(1,2-epoxy-1,2-dihydrophenyl)acetyl-CoA isomerase
MSAAQVQPLRLEREGAIATIVFNRPQQLNAIDVATAHAFDAACAAIEHDDSVRVVVVCGEGRSFGVGGDLRGFTESPQATALELIDPMHSGLLRLTRMPVPVIASLQGNVSGGSLSLALGCDLVIAADDTRFNLAYVNVAASCDVGGSWHLTRRVGLHRAMEIALLGETIEADQARKWGLVTKVVPVADLQATTHALATRLASGPTAAYGRLKRLMRTALDNDLPTQLDLEREGFHASAGTDDFAEALQAFFERRQPRFSGH